MARIIKVKPGSLTITRFWRIQSNGLEFMDEINGRPAVFIGVAKTQTCRHGDPGCSRSTVQHRLFFTRPTWINNVSGMKPVMDSAYQWALLWHAYLKNLSRFSGLMYYEFNASDSMWDYMELWLEYEMRRVGDNHKIYWFKFKYVPEQNGWVSVYDGSWQYWVGKLGEATYPGRYCQRPMFWPCYIDIKISIRNRKHWWFSTGDGDDPHAVLSAIFQDLKDSDSPLTDPRPLIPDLHYVLAQRETCAAPTKFINFYDTTNPPPQAATGYGVVRTVPRPEVQFSTSADWYEVATPGDSGTQDTTYGTPVQDTYTASQKGTYRITWRASRNARTITVESSTHSETKTLTSTNPIPTTGGDYVHQVFAYTDSPTTFAFSFPTTTSARWIKLHTPAPLSQNERPNFARFTRKHQTLSTTGKSTAKVVIIGTAITVIGGLILEGVRRWLKW